MKIKNLKCRLGVVWFAFNMALTTMGCGSEFKEIKQIVVEQQETIDELTKTTKLQAMTVENLEQQVEILTEKLETYIEENDGVLTLEEINQLTNKIQNETVYGCFYDENMSELSLEPKIGYYDRQINLADTVYSDINLLLKQSCVKKLTLHCTNFDLSRLDISSIEEISVFQVDFEHAKEIMETASSNNIVFNYNVIQEDNRKVLNYMIENDITCLGHLVIGVKDEKELTKISNLLKKAKVKSVSLALPHIEEENISFDIRLNDYIQYFSLHGNYLFEEDLEGDKVLSNISIYSNNQELVINLNDVIITEDTKFIVPDNSEVWIFGSHTDVMPFYDLKNTSKVYYYDSILSNGYHSDQLETYDDFIDIINSNHNKKLVK